MRVAVASAAVPLRDDAEAAMGAGLLSALRDAGHEAELLLLPFAEALDLQLAQRLAYRSMALAPACDLLVTLRSPAEVLRHPRKVAWLLEVPPLPREERTHRSPAAIKACSCATLAGLREARRVLAADGTVAALLHRAGVEAGIVAPGDWKGAVALMVA